MLRTYTNGEMADPNWRSRLAGKIPYSSVGHPGAYCICPPKDANAGRAVPAARPQGLVYRTGAVGSRAAAECEPRVSVLGRARLRSDAAA